MDLLIKTGRAPEAALFARTYAPRFVHPLSLVKPITNAFSFLTTYSKVPEAVQSWTSDLKSKGRSKLAAGIADPSTNPELFEEGWEEALQREKAVGLKEGVLVDVGASGSGAKGEDEEDEDEEEEEEEDEEEDEE